MELAKSVQRESKCVIFAGQRFRTEYQFTSDRSETIVYTRKPLSSGRSAVLLRGSIRRENQREGQESVVLIRKNNGATFALYT